MSGSTALSPTGAPSDDDGSGTGDYAYSLVPGGNPFDPPDFAVREIVETPPPKGEGTEREEFSDS